MERRREPPAAVSRAWGLAAAVPLPGGQGDAWRAGDLVLKPVADAARAAAVAEALEPVVDRAASDHGVRISRPARSAGGEWVVDGWAAWGWLDGEPFSGPTDELLEVSARFHAVVAGVPWSAAMAGDDRWAVADRMAWDDDPSPVPATLRSLAEARMPVDLPSQLVHGDLSGNVLTHPTLGPAVIDVSPYWRPAGYADAIILVDRIAWTGESLEVLNRWAEPQGHQLLIRASLFRALSEGASTHAYDDLIRHLT